MSGAGQGPSFKTDLHRNKTKKWVEAPSYDYGGDDWGVADEYGEYGSYDDEPQPQPQPGNSYHGHTASVSSARGRDSYASQPPQPHRIPSYEANDEQRAFSTVTSPVISQEEMLNTFPPQRFSQQQQLPAQEARRPSGAGSAQHFSPQIQDYHSPVPSYSQHQSPRFDIQHAGPSHEPEYDDRAYPGDEQNQGLGLSTGQDEHDPRHSWLPPLPSEMAANQQHYSAMNHQARLPPFPPRKSSLSSRSRPDLNKLYQAQQPAMPQPSEEHASFMQPSYGQQQTQEEERDEEEEQQAAPAFIRPADIYKRLAEAKEKERQSMESARNSPERPALAMNPRTTADKANAQDDYASPPSSAIGQQSSEARLSRPFLGSVLPDAPAQSETTREAPVAEPSDDSHVETAPNHPEQTSTVAAIASTVTNALHLPGLSISNPMLARALGISHDDAETSAESKETTATSPTLPSISRFSGFGSLTDGIWNNQTSRTADEGKRDDAAHDSQPTGEVEAIDQSPQRDNPRDLNEREEIPNEATGLGANSQRSAQSASSASSRHVPQAIFAHQHNRSLAADSDSVSSPTAYYFSDQAGSLDDRIQDEPAYEGSAQRDDYPDYPRHANTPGAIQGHMSHGMPAQFDSGEQSMNDSEASKVLDAPGPLPPAAAAVSREELEADHARTPSRDYENTDNVQRPNETSDDSHLDAPTPSAEWSYDLGGEEEPVDADEPIESIEPIEPKEYMQATTPTASENPETTTSVNAPRALPDSSQTLTRDEIEQAYATHTSPLNVAGRNETSNRTSAERPNMTDSHDVEQHNTASFPEDRYDETSRETYLPGTDHTSNDFSEREVPAVTESNQSFGNLRQPPAPVSSRFLQNPLQIDPINRGTSPGGRVKQMAEKYDVIHTLSRQSTMQSPTGSATGSRSGKESSGRSVKEYDRPHLPGEWVSYADTINSITDSDRQEPGYYDDDLGGEDETELDRTPTPTPRHEEESITTPKRSHAEEPIDFSPTMEKRRDASHPLSALAAAGQALATSLMSSVGMQGNDDDDDESESEAAESALPSGDVTPDVTDRGFTGFQSQPSTLSRSIPVSSEDPLTTRNESMPSQHAQIQQMASPNVVREASSEPVSLDDTEDASVSEEDELPPPAPAPLRPRSNIGRPTVDTTPQRPIWPSTTSAMSINYSPEDTESDRLRKDVLRSLSPGPDLARKSVDAEPEPRSSTDYPRFSAVPDTTPERRMASTPLHLSPPTANTTRRDVEPVTSSTTQSAQSNLLSVHPLSAVNMSRESTVLPREYDSYWAERNSQDDEVMDSPQVPAIGVTQPISPPSPAHNDFMSALGNVSDPIKKSEPEARSASPARPNYLAKRFSWENADEAEPRQTEQGVGQAPAATVGASAPQPNQNVPLPPTSNLLATNSVVSPITTPLHSREASAIVEPSQVGSSQISRDVSQSSGPQTHLDETDDHPTQLPGDSEVGDSPAQYKYERPFQRARGPSESEGAAKTGLRKTSSAARPFALADRSRTISSGHFSSQGAALAGTESSQPGFKTIMAMRDTSDRIATFDKTREGFAAMDTGLDDWLKYMLRANQELANDSHTLNSRTNTGGFAGSMRHKFSPSIAKLTKAPVGAGSPTSPSSRVPSSSAAFGDTAAPSTATRQPSYSQRRTPSMSEASKGKAFLQTAGLNAKGIFAKGRSKFRGVSGEKVEPLPIRRRASPKREIPVAANHDTLNDSDDVPSTKSPTPIWAAFASVKKDDQGLPTPSNKGDYFTGKPQEEETVVPTEPSNTEKALTQLAPASHNDQRMVMRSDDLGNELPDTNVRGHTTFVPRTEDTGYNDANVPVQQADHTTNHSHTMQHDGRQPASTFNDEMEDRPISPIQSQSGRPTLAFSPNSRAMLSSEDMPISPIVRDFSTHNTSLSAIKRESINSIVSPPTTPRGILRNSENYKPRPHTIAVSDSVADQLVRSVSSDNQIQPASPQPLSPLQPPRLSLALEKQNSATVTETEIHPALVHRTSSYGGSVSNAGRPESRHRGSSVGPKPPPNIARLPPSVQKRYASYNSSDFDSVATPTRRAIDQYATPISLSSASALPTNISTDAALSNGVNNTPQQPRKRSKSPFTRSRERSRSRDARQHARNDELLSQHYDEQRPAMPSYPPSRVSVATSAALTQREMSLPNLVDSADPTSPAVVSPSSTKTKSSPFARFRERSRGRSFGRASVPVATDTSEAQNAATPTRPALATRTMSGANGDRSVEQTVTSESDRRGRSRSFARFRTKSSTNTSDPIDATTPNGDRSRSKRRSWYNQFLCYDEHGIPVDAPLPPRPQSQGARSRSRTDVMRHSSYNVSSTNGLDMPQEPVPPLSDAEYAEQEEVLAQNQRDRSRSVSRKRLASMTEAEREARVRSLRDKAMFAMRPQEDGVGPDDGKEVRRASRVYGPEPPSRSASVDTIESARRKFGPELPPEHAPPLPPTPKQYQQSPPSAQPQQQPQPQNRPWATPNHQRQNASFLEHKERRRQQLMANQTSSANGHGAAPALPQPNGDRAGSAPQHLRADLQLPIHDAEARDEHRRPHVPPSSQKSAQVEVILPGRVRDADQEQRQTQPDVASTATSQVSREVDLPIRDTHKDVQQEGKQPDVASSTVPREANLPDRSRYNDEKQSRRQQDLASPNRASLPGLPPHLQHLQLTLSPLPASMPANDSRAQAPLFPPTQQAPPRSDVLGNNEGPKDAIHREMSPLESTSQHPNPTLSPSQNPVPTNRPGAPVPRPGQQAQPHPNVQVNNIGPPHPTHGQTTPLDPTPTSASQDPPTERRRAESIGTSVHVNVGQDHEGDQGTNMPSLPAVHARSTYPLAHTAQLPTGPAPAQSSDIMRWRESVAGASTSIADSTSVAAPLVGGDNPNRWSNPTRKAREPWPLPDAAPAGEEQGAYRMSGALGQGAGRREVGDGRGRNGMSRMNGSDRVDDENVVFSSTLEGPGWEWRPGGEGEGDE